MKVNSEQIADALNQLSYVVKTKHKYDLSRAFSEFADTIKPNTSFCEGAFTENGGRKVCASAHIALELNSIKDIIKTGVKYSKTSKGYLFDFNYLNKNGGKTEISSGDITAQLFKNFLSKKYPTLANKSDSILSFIILLNDSISRTSSNKERAQQVKELLTVSAAVLGNS